MITRREFEDTVNQVNKLFHAIEKKLEDVEKRLSDLETPKRTPRKKTT